MTQENVTPSQDHNQPTANENPIDNMGNPINSDGTPRDQETTQESTETVESLQKQLKDTKAALTKAQQGKTEETETSTETDTTLEIQKQTQEAEKSGVDMEKFSNEFAESGSLSEDSYKELADKGFNKEVVDAYIEGQKAIAARQTSEVAAVIGGEDQFNTLKEWAAENLTETEINAFNASVTSGTDSAKLAVQGLQARYVAENGQSPNLIGGETTTQTGDTFKSSFEMTKAMEDPRYWSDPDYQKEVQAKAERSQKAGTL